METNHGVGDSATEFDEDVISMLEEIEREVLEKAQTTSFGEIVDYDSATIADDFIAINGMIEDSITRNLVAEDFATQCFKEWGERGDVAIIVDGKMVDEQLVGSDPKVFIGKVLAIVVDKSAENWDGYYHGDDQFLCVTETEEPYFIISESDEKYSVVPFSAVTEIRKMIPVPSKV